MHAISVVQTFFYKFRIHFNRKVIGEFVHNISLNFFFSDIFLKINTLLLNI